MFSARTRRRSSNKPSTTWQWYCRAILGCCIVIAFLIWLSVLADINESDRDWSAAISGHPRWADDTVVNPKMASPEYDPSWRDWNETRQADDRRPIDDGTHASEATVQLEADSYLRRCGVINKLQTHRDFTPVFHAKLISVHHKTGTHYVREVIWHSLDSAGYTIMQGDLCAMLRFAEEKAVFLLYHHPPAFQRMLPYFVKGGRTSDVKVVHVIRDPRDVLVSGYYYHLWTKEEWVRDNGLQAALLHIGGRPRSIDELDLNSAHGKKVVAASQRHRTGTTGLQSRRDSSTSAAVALARGYQIEMRSNWFRNYVRGLREWRNDEGPSFRYEDLWLYPIETWEKLFQALGFDEFTNWMKWSAMEYSGKEFTKSGDHASPTNAGNFTIKRSGTPGGWKGEFTASVCQEFYVNFSDVLEKYGYKWNRVFHEC